MSTTPSLSPVVISPRNITAKELEARECLLAQARELEGQARAVRKSLAALEEQIAAWVLAKAPKERTVNRSGYRLSIVAVRKSVSWLTEFLKRATLAEKADIEAAQPLVDRLQIEKL